MIVLIAYHHKDIGHYLLFANCRKLLIYHEITAAQLLINAPIDLQSSDLQAIQ
ncbi:MAG: hypothetical protein MUE44_16945 [Oscillatoriaceae cyanobacterium Prado104]|nr:hypothetical protein [Oscillatoriaceae cyanobacterium Prado104]